MTRTKLPRQAAKHASEKINNQKKWFKSTKSTFSIIPATMKESDKKYFEALEKTKRGKYTKSGKPRKSHKSKKDVYVPVNISSDNVRQSVTTGFSVPPSTPINDVPSTPPRTPPRSQSMPLFRSSIVSRDMVRDAITEHVSSSISDAFDFVFVPMSPIKSPMKFIVSVYPVVEEFKLQKNDLPLCEIVQV